MHNSKWAQIAREKFKGLLGGKCVDCGATENLEIHHKDRNTANNDISNLELHCHKCHREQHRKENAEKTSRKTDVAIVLPKELVEKSHGMGINISRVCELALIERIKIMEEIGMKYIPRQKSNTPAHSYRSTGEKKGECESK